MEFLGIRNVGKAVFASDLVEVFVAAGEVVKARELAIAILIDEI